MIDNNAQMRAGFSVKYYGPIRSEGIEIYPLPLAKLRHLCSETSQFQGKI